MILIISFQYVGDKKLIRPDSKSKSISRLTDQSLKSNLLLTTFQVEKNSNCNFLQWFKKNDIDNQ